MSSFYFDKIIDLTFYDASGGVLGVLETPSTGRKPEIVVSGTMLAGNQAIQSTVEITNLDTSFSVSEVKWIEAVLGYKDWKASSNRAMFFSVLYVDQTETPPDKKFSFTCTTAAQDPDIVFQRVSVYLEKGKKLSELMQAVVGGYNEALFASYPASVADKVRLTGTLLNVEDLVSSADIVVSGSTLWSLMRTIEMEFTSKENIQGIASAQSNQVYLGVDENKLVAYASAQAVGLRVDSSQSYTLDYVIKAVRTGPVYSITSLFDPRIRVGDKLKIPVSALVTKRVGTGLVDIPVDAEGYVSVYADVQIVYSFGTLQPNSMVIDKAIDANVDRTNTVKVGV